MARLDFIANGENFITSNGRQFRVVGERQIDVDSFEVNFYQTDSDHRTVAKNLKWELKMWGTLRNGTSIVNPVILVESNIAYFQRNYAYIPIFQRYYFVTDVKSIRKNLWEISLKCDVLMTYKEGILSISTRVLRSEDKSIRNVNITDTMGITQSSALVGRHQGRLKSGTWFYPRASQFEVDFDIFGARHLLVKLACSAYTTTNHVLPIVPEFGYVWATMSGESLRELVFYISDMGPYSSDFTIDDIILDIKWIPVEVNLPNKGQLWMLRYGEGQVPWSDKIINCYGEEIYVTDKVLSLKASTVWELYELPLSDIRYQNVSPFKSMSIDFGQFGQIPIKSEVWGNDRNILVQCEVDCLTGDAVLWAVKSDSPYRERLGTANVAYPINITSVTRAGRQEAGVLANTLTTLAGGALGSIVTMNPLPAITSTIGAVGHMISGINPPPKFNTVNGNGGTNANYMLLPELHTERLPQYEPNPRTQGYLSNADIQLSKIHGYCLVAGGVHINGLLKQGQATKSEVDEIEQLLTSGVILP